MPKLRIRFDEEVPKGRAACFDIDGQFLGTVPIPPGPFRYGTREALFRDEDYRALVASGVDIEKLR